MNLTEFGRQRESLDTGWMTLAKWLSGYPPLAERLAAIQPELASGPHFAHRGPVRAVFILAAIFLVPMFAGVAAVAVLGSLGKAFEEKLVSEFDDSAEADEFAGFGDGETMDSIDIEDATAQVYLDAADLARVIREFEGRNNMRIEDIGRAYEVWSAEHPDREPPPDPFDGLNYGFIRTETGFTIYSSGPDQSPQSEDDIIVAFDD